MKKLSRLIAFLVLCVGVYILFGVIPKDYVVNYTINSFSIQEKYDKSKKSYIFSIANKDVTYEYSFKSKYTNKRGLLQSVELKAGCMSVKLIDKRSFSLCKNEDGYYTNYAYNIITGEQKDSFNNINIYELLEKKIFIWNYNGFLSLDNNEYEELEIFKKDVYEPIVVSKIKDYILIADYDQKYSFNAMYLIDSKNNKIERINLDNDIYFNSYILGTNKNNVYLYDKQKEKEYRINPFKKTVDKNAYEILVDNSWEKVSKNKLNKGNVSFYDSTDYYYYIDGDKLYYKTINSVLLVSDLNISNIIESNEKEAFFISGNILYYNSIDKGTKKLLEYSEWNFNSKNIYIF